MTPVVLQVQQDALNRDVPVTDLLRKALVVAHKLGLGEFEAWVRRELEGYTPGDMYPPYRQMKGQVRGWNPYRGWLPVHFQSPEHAERIGTRPTPQPVAEIEHLLAEREGEGGELQMPFDPAAEQVLQRGVRDVTSFSCFIPDSALVGILNAVRNTILNWTLELEAKGVVGENLSFTPEEVKAASQVAPVTNLFMGPVQTAQIQQSSPHAIQVSAPAVDLEGVRRLLEILKPQLSTLDLTPGDRASVVSDVATIEAALTAPSPKHSVLRECLQSLRRVVEGAAGSAAGQLILGELIKLLG